MAGETLIYTGPNVLALALERFKVFRGGLPFFMRRAIEKIPEIEKLIVPISELEATPHSAKMSHAKEAGSLP